MSPEGTWNEALAARWDAICRTGWEYLLPLRDGARWLCLDASDGATAAVLSSVCPEVTAFAANDAVAARLGARFELLGAGGAVRIALPGDLAKGGRRFDGFIVHDVEGTLGRDELESALSAARAVLADDGFVYLGLRNRYGYARLRRDEAGPSHPVRNHFRPGDFAAHWTGWSVTTHPLTLRPRGRILDVIGPRGYVSARNPSSRGERLRRLLLGSRGAPLVAPAFAVVAASPGAPPTALDAALRDLEMRRGDAPRSLGFRRYHCLHGGKAVVSARPEAGDGEGSILIFARSPQAIERREREFEILRGLGQLPPDIARHVPRPEGRSRCAGAEVFTIQEFDGVTLDTPVEGLEVATRDGAAFLVRLHRQTARRERILPERFAALCGPMFESAASRYPVLAGRLERLRRAVGSGLAGLEIPLVWLHGDFKVENLVVDTRTSRLAGVIDWEHSEREGLPLVDLWYLLFYNRQIRSGTHFFPAVEALIPPRRLEPGEAALCDEYVRALDIPAAAIAPLVGASIVHHCGRRIFYDNQDKAMMERIGTAVDAASAWIEAADRKAGDVA